MERFARRRLTVAVVRVDEHAVRRQAYAWAAVAALLACAALQAGEAGTPAMAPEGTKLFENNAPKNALEDRLKMAYDEFIRKNEMKQQIDGVKEILDKAKQNGTAPATGDKAAQWTNYQQKGGDNAADKAKAAEEAAQYKEKLVQNLGYIKEMFAKGELKFQEEQYREAAAFYAGVVMADVPNSDQMVQQARAKFAQMETFAKQHYDNAMSADLQRDYTREVEELAVVVREFPFSKVYPEANTRMISLKTNPKVAGLVELTEAESTEAAGYTLKAYKMYEAISNNPRYENTVAAVKAHAKMTELSKNAATREQMKTDLQAEAEKEAPKLMAAAENYLMNNMASRAKEKLNAIIEKFPGTSFADDAQKKLESLPQQAAAK
ncbi:MAG: hypothetical protein HS116_17740 [Planctomycetes bacterium]|nr:hypothetical protein [Planctomycetota bacterium]